MKKEFNQQARRFFCSALLLICSTIFALGQDAKIRIDGILKNPEYKNQWSAIEKMKTKRLDLIVANDISAPGIGFQSDSNQVAIIKSEQDIERLPLLSKQEVANILLDRIRDSLKKQP